MDFKESIEIDSFGIVWGKIMYEDRVAVCNNCPYNGSCLHIINPYSPLSKLSSFNNYCSGLSYQIAVVSKDEYTYIPLQIPEEILNVKRAEDEEQ